MKNKVILLMLLFVFTYTKAQGQTVVYTYNAQGSCTSRVIRGTLPKAKKAQKDPKGCKWNELYCKCGIDV